MTTERLFTMFWAAIAIHLSMIVGYWIILFY
jgi:hypothetical protein